MSGRNAARTGTPAGRPVRAPRSAAVGPGGAVTGRTGTLRTVPQEQPSSGCGHWLWRPHARQRTVTQVSVQVRWVIGKGAAPRWIGGASGAPQAQG
ncbi:hypothetical protein GCM10022284_56850 [Streptomyces hundungensis]